MSAASEWFAVDVLVDAEAAEAAGSAFDNFDCLGVETDIWKKSVDEAIRVSGFFERPSDLTLIEAAIRQELEIYGFPSKAIKSVSCRTIEHTDWLAEWKKHWRPVEIGRFVIAPPWADVAKSEKHIIRIEPNMAFGTGTHETTQLCLTAIDQLVKPGSSFLDIGTGTGILAIAAAELRASPVVACDTDPSAIELAVENAKANSVDIEFYHGSIDDRRSVFDLVCANLTLDVILPVLDRLLARSGKTLILSGILSEQEAEICDALSFRHMFRPRIERAGEWIAVRIDL